MQMTHLICQIDIKRALGATHRLFEEKMIISASKTKFMICFVVMLKKTSTFVVQGNPIERVDIFCYRENVSKQFQSVRPIQ